MDDFPQCMHIALLRVGILKSRQGLGVESFSPRHRALHGLAKRCLRLGNPSLKTNANTKGKDKMHRLIKRPEASLAILL
jgi:hypothetical protein